MLLVAQRVLTPEGGLATNVSGYVRGPQASAMLCCGAQMWMEEQNRDRMNVRRTQQLLDTGAETIASACPFCVTMLTDGLKDQEKEDGIRQLDIAEC